MHCKERFVDMQGVIRSQNSKNDRLWNGQGVIRSQKSKNDRL
jgi:hypothetical protein